MTARPPRRLLERALTGDLLPCLALAALPFVFHWQVALARLIWFGGDFIQLFYPFGLELGRSLHAGHLPLWSDTLALGFPLLAEGEVGALYPPNLALFALLPAQIAISYALLIHLAVAATGMYLLARVLGVGRAGAFVAGIAFSFNGLVFAHLAHPPIIAALSWLPWLLLFQRRFQLARTAHARRAGIWFGLTVFTLALVLLAGSPQFALLDAMLFGLFGVLGRWLTHSVPDPARSRLRNWVEPFVETGVMAALALAIAAVQLLPTLELVGLSVRRAGVGAADIASYSLPPRYLVSLLFPFSEGEAAGVFTEYYAYLGITVLALGIVGLVMRRNRLTLFLGVLALGALALALGDLNPLYPLVARVPILNFFRVPARYLAVFIFAVCLLAAHGVDALAARAAPTSPRERRFVIAGAAVVLAAALALQELVPVSVWLKVWQVLPLLLLLGLALVFWLARSKRANRAIVALLLSALVLLDVTLYAPPFLGTLYQLVPPSFAEAVPRSIQALDRELDSTRTFTDLTYYPSLPALRGSLFPNTALIYDKAGTMIYTSLALARHANLVAQPAPLILNLQHAGLYMIPLETLAPNVPLAPPSRLALDVVERPVHIAPIAASAVELSMFAANAPALAPGTVVGRVVLDFEDGSTRRIPLRWGIEIGAWDAERRAEQEGIRSPQPPRQRPFPAFWRAYGKPFQGHAYQAQFALDPARRLSSVRVRSLFDEGQLVVEDVSFQTASGGSVSLATLSGKNRFELAYLSDTVAVWRNLDAYPRAYLAYKAEVVDDSGALERLRQSDLNRDTVLLAQGNAPAGGRGAGGAGRVEIVRAEPGRLELAVETDRAGFLVVADTWYPGWTATVDGIPTDIVRANYYFRAVPLSAGSHTIVMAYAPASFALGEIITLFGVIGTLAVSAGLYGRRGAGSG